MKNQTNGAAENGVGGLNAPAPTRNPGVLTINPGTVMICNNTDMLDGLDAIIINQNSTAVFRSENNTTSIHLAANSTETAEFTVDRNEIHSADFASLVVRNATNQAEEAGQDNLMGVVEQRDPTGIAGDF